MNHLSSASRGSCLGGVSSSNSAGSPGLLVISPVSRLTRSFHVRAGAISTRLADTMTVLAASNATSTASRATISCQSDVMLVTPLSWMPATSRAARAA
ncbi:hypothetical protein SALBM135S_05514 [Streptomyces alboniger]